MPGHFIDLSEQELRSSPRWTEIYTLESYQAYLKKGVLIRPSGVGIGHFEPEILDSVFSIFEKHQNLLPAFNSELRLSTYVHSFTKDPQQTPWPWSCGLSTLYKNVPVVFPFISTSHAVMQSDLSEDIKFSHLREVLTPTLKEKNIIIRFLHKKDSLTHRLLFELGKDFCFDYRLVRENPDGQLLSTYFFGRSPEELALLGEEDFWRVETELSKEWLSVSQNEKYRALQETKGYNPFPREFI